MGHCPRGQVHCTLLDTSLRNATVQLVGRAGLSSRCIYMQAQTVQCFEDKECMHIQQVLVQVLRCVVPVADLVALQASWRWVLVCCCSCTWQASITPRTHQRATTLLLMPR